MANMAAIELEMTRFAIFLIAISILATAIGLWITYFVIKCAIRDGINESRLGDRWQQAVARATPAQAHQLPEMRADR